MLLSYVNNVYAVQYFLYMLSGNYVLLFSSSVFCQYFPKDSFEKKLIWKISRHDEKKANLILSMQRV